MGLRKVKAHRITAALAVVELVALVNKFSDRKMSLEDDRALGACDDGIQS